MPVQQLVQSDGPMFSDIMALCTDPRMVDPKAFKVPLAVKFAVQSVIEYIHRLKERTSYRFPISAAESVTMEEYDNLHLSTPWEEVSQLCIDLYNAISAEVEEKRCIGMVNKMDPSLQSALEDMTAAAALMPALMPAPASALMPAPASAPAATADASALAPVPAVALAACVAAFTEKTSSRRYPLAVAPVECAAKLAAAFVPVVLAKYSLSSIMCGLVGIGNWPIDGLSPLDPVIAALTSFNRAPPDQQIGAILGILQKFDEEADRLFEMHTTGDEKYVYRWSYCDPREGSVCSETGHAGWLENLGHYLAFLREGLAISLPYMYSVPAASEARLIIVWHDGVLINWPDKKDERSPLALMAEARAAIAAGKCAAEVKEKFLKDFADGVLAPISYRRYVADMFPGFQRGSRYPYATAVLEHGRLRFIGREAHELLSETKETFLASLDTEAAAP